jgi:BirA family transcriptional regulator, biotin operon repressor / biotin---[acetyl-CoA-carboxylase] ligase
MIIGSNIFFRKNLPSTNSYAASLLRENKGGEGTIIYTNYQSDGRGQAGNRWESEDGKNLLISIIIFPSMISPSDQFLISMSFSLGISDFIKRYISSVSIKWPNDIYVNNDKIAGILIENAIMGVSIEHTIAGIGININQEKFISNAPNPVSLSIVTGTTYDIDKCLQEIASDLDIRYKQLITGNYEIIRRDYSQILYRRNLWSRFSDTDGLFTGRIYDVTDHGRLRIERENGSLSEYSFKEVEFIR